MDNDRDQQPDVDSTAEPRVDASGKAAADFAWPPTNEDFDGYVVVPLGGDGRAEARAEARAGSPDGLDRGALTIGGFPMQEADARLRRKKPGVFTMPVTLGGFPLRVEAQTVVAPSVVPPPLPPPLPIPVPPPLPAQVARIVAAAEPEPMAPPTAVAEPAAHAHVIVSAGLWSVEEVEPELPPVEVPEVIRETSSMGPRLRASLTLAVAASLALLSWSQFKGLRRDAIPPSPEPLSVSARHVPEPVAAMPAVPTTALAQPTPAAEPVPEAIVEAIPEPAPQPVRLAPRPTPRPTPRPVAAPEIRQAVATPPAAPAPAPTRAMLTSVSAPAPAMTLASAEVEAPVVVAAVDAGPSDEDSVRSTLAHWRTAYSQLDARAAKRVYPGLDVRALERAFQGLKSQDVRFDSCELTMQDGSAQANCTGRATFVPRVGSQAPITTQRQWRFELKRLDQGWTIASARTAAS